MPIFMTKFSYTYDAWQKLAKHPEDRSIPVKALFEGLGGRLIGMYYMMGDSDGIIISEMPDAKTAATAIVAAGLAGHTRKLETTQLFSIQEGLEILGGAGKIAYPAPKG